MLSTLIVTWVSVIVLMIFAWLILLIKNNPGVVDVFWSMAITLSALIFSLQEPTNSVKIIFQILLVIWAIRLAGYLFLKRVLPQHIDKRYSDLSEQWKGSKNIGFLINFQLQGILAIGIACSFIFINQINTVNTSTIIAICIICCGIIGESIADYQLQQFKQLNKGSVCNIGLWSWSRHPNYFFEWLIWIGFAIAGLGVTLGWVGFFSPALLLFIFLKITAPITEAGSVKSRGQDYLNYQKKTSMLIPWPPKKD